MANLRSYLHTTVPAPLTDDGAAVVDLRSHLVKIDREYATQRYAETDAPLLYIRIQIGKATCSALIDCGASRNFISQAFMACAGLGLRVRRKTQPTQVTLVDDRTQKSIDRCVDGVPVYFAPLACEPVSLDILDTKFDMILGMSWLCSADHPVNFHDRTVHIRDRSGVLVPCTVGTPHTSIACRVVSVARICDAIARNDVEEMGLVFLHALPSPDGPAASPSGPRIAHLLDEYRDVFKAPTETVPDRPIRHAITLEAGAVPPRGCIYRMSEEELEVLRVQLDDLLDKGWIRPSCSPYGAPVLFVWKKNKDLRLCIDYRKLNAKTVKNAGPLPRIDDLLERLGSATYFSKLDLKSGYHQIEIQPQDRYKTVFKMRYGHFEWVVMPFGLTNAPATFQAAMTTEFRDLLDRSVLICLYGILVYSRTLDEHIVHLHDVLERLRLAKYKANLDKLKKEAEEQLKLQQAEQPSTSITPPPPLTATQRLKKEAEEQLKLQQARVAELARQEAVELEATTDHSRREYLLQQLERSLTDDRCAQITKHMAEMILLEHKITNSQFTNWDDRFVRLERRFPPVLQIHLSSSTQVGESAVVSVETNDDDVYLGAARAASFCYEDPDPDQDPGQDELQSIAAFFFHLKEQKKSKSELIMLRPLINSTRITGSLDCGATRNFMSPSAVKKLHLGMKVQQLQQPLLVRIGDSTVISIREKVKGIPVTFDTAGKVRHSLNFYIFRELPFDLVFSMQWLRAVNPRIDWQIPRVELPDNQGVYQQCMIAAEHLPKTSCYCLRAREFHALSLQYHHERLFIALVKQTDAPHVSCPPEIQQVVDQYADLMQEPFGLPNRPTKHHIELLPGAVPPKGRIYRMSPDELEELRKQLETLISKGWIRPSTSEFGAPVLFVRKGNDEFRMCIDYRGLNKITRKSTEPLPRIDDLLDMVQGCIVFSKVDLKSGYHQIEMAEEDVYKTAFKTRYGTYEFLVMPFGLCNAPGTFQTEMHLIFRPYLDKFMVVYLDDILVFSKTAREHAEHLALVLQSLRDSQYKINREKSSFGVPSVIYLGHVISGDGLAPEAAKIAAIQEWPQPQTVRDVRSFMGLASYYRKFVRNFSAVAAPLTNLTKKDTPFLWSLHCQLAFTRLKKALTRAPVLKLPDPTLPFILTTDASQYGIGAVLQQDDGNGLRPVEFMSKKIKTQKLQDSTYEKELYALVCALKHWKHFLLGRHFKIFSDHSTLQWMKSQGELNDKLARRPSPIRTGDHVWVASSRLSREEDLSPKLLPRYLGPWQVADRFGPLYVIDVPLHLRTYPVFHASKLLPFMPADAFPDRPPQFGPPIPGKGYDVEWIEDEWGTGPDRQYLVRFAFQPPSENRWFYRRDLLKTAKSVVLRYEAAHKGNLPRRSPRLHP
ncbi:hypothetical protein CBR_g81537 [Chara braunii]|uniref:Reverse transcriptase domain-containing protein n=1 Tax=Chara braunii TaxID=69332 RepID=A0A388KAY7_CHABU|nr:hypothetical protein CBR_g81537 [Chara braunii]|eukprot:GBG67113.1 hypothetical protein CBR_g81537 [Chara braunii]